MAKKKSQPWDKVFERVRVSHYADQKSRPKPTAAELDAVEAQLGFHFPLSYRVFAERFGLGGCLRGGSEAEIFILTPPQDNEWPSHRSSVVEDTLQLRGYSRDQHAMYGEQYPKMKFEQLVRFGGGDDYAFMFYPPEVTDARRRECRIYTSSSSWGLESRADSFAEWLDLTNQYFASWGDESVAGYPVVFKPNPPVPDVIPYSADDMGSKVAPEVTALALWLSLNHKPAHTLDMSIRDHGQTDAFPILADALQEAGCTNADLLDSCRHGDPDIDGVWVLQVLLGEKKSQ